jgi:hypothetical protein
LRPATILLLGALVLALLGFRFAALLFLVLALLALAANVGGPRPG